MKLFLNAVSEKGIAYTPDWMKIQFTKEGVEYVLTLDIQAFIDFKGSGLNCRAKGELIPWELLNVDTDEEFNLEENEIKFTKKQVIDAIKNANAFTIGVFPVTSMHQDESVIFNDAKEDKLMSCDGELFISLNDENFDFEFVFETELNYF